MSSGTITATVSDQFGNAATRGSDRHDHARVELVGREQGVPDQRRVDAVDVHDYGRQLVGQLPLLRRAAGAYSVTFTNDASLTNPGPLGFTVMRPRADHIAFTSAPSSSTAGASRRTSRRRSRTRSGTRRRAAATSSSRPRRPRPARTRRVQTTGGTTQATYTIPAGSVVGQLPLLRRARRLLLDQHRERRDEPDALEPEPDRVHGERGGGRDDRVHVGDEHVDGGRELRARSRRRSRMRSGTRRRRGPTSRSRRVELDRREQGIQDPRRRYRRARSRSRRARRQSSFRYYDQARGHATTSRSRTTRR